MMNKVKTMKAQTVWLYLVASFLLIVSFSSCRNQNEQTENTGNRNQVEKREVADRGPAKQDVPTENQKTKESQPETQRKKHDGPLVTLIELGSVRCVPCRMMQPILDEVKKEYAGKVKVLFYDVWTPEGKAKAAPHRIRVIPTQVFLDKNGKEYFRHEGFFAKNELVQVLEKKLK